MSLNGGSPSLIGSVVERTPTGKATFRQPGASRNTGFPAALHRSKSAFSKSREELRNGAPQKGEQGHSWRGINPPTQSSEDKFGEGTDSWRDQVGRENDERIASMTEEEREEERKEVLERFGKNIGDVLMRVRENRLEGRKKERDALRTSSFSTSKHATEPDDAFQNLQEVPLTRVAGLPGRKSAERTLSPPPSAMSTPATRPSSRIDRTLRFAEPSPQDVHVYESAPPSPRRRILALPPPPSDADGVVSLGDWKGKLSDSADPPLTPPQSNDVEPEEGTPEYIRRRFFPRAPPHDPSIAWMELSTEVEDDKSLPFMRFDFNGDPIPPHISSTLPTHLGLHHHSEGTHAGYTLDDIFVLSRSSVPAQRATMLRLLVRVARNVMKVKQGDSIAGMEEVAGNEDELRKRMLAAGVEAMTERGTVGVQAIELIWQCLVGWDDDQENVEGVELEKPEDVAIKSLQLKFFLPQIAALIGTGAVPSETAVQLLSILYHLAQRSNSVATDILSTPQLVSTIVQTFLLLPIPPSNGSMLPQPLALQLLIALASSSRKNAEGILQYADSLLRFITFRATTSYAPPLSNSLLINTLRLYSTLSSYGMYAHITATALEQFTRLGQHVVSESCTSTELMKAWLTLIAVWTVCATDPHCTSPSHDLLWTQYKGLGWIDDVRELMERLSPEEANWTVWSQIWRAQSAYLLGSKVNESKGGEQARLGFLDYGQSGFENGKEAVVLGKAIDQVHRELVETPSELPRNRLHALAECADVISSAIRLWLDCIPSHTKGPPASPPFSIPYTRISELYAVLVKHPLWSLIALPDKAADYVSCRKLTELLSSCIRLSRRLSGISENLWTAQAFSVLLRLMPGDEAFALDVVDDLLNLFTPEWGSSRSFEIPSTIWERGGMSIIKPFLVHAVRPLEDVMIAPLRPSPRSILESTTQQLPALSIVHHFGLPMRRDWTFSAVDHLLRSGDSPVFKALPKSWDASEVEVTRVSLLLSIICRDVLHRSSLTDFAVSREEMVFSCMKVYMLEHDQPQNDASEEIFRDSIVQTLMEEYTRPYSVFAAASTQPDPSQVVRESLETVAGRLLGPSVPFYQYYTDFVALYDAISFSQPMFARLILPPLSMRYAIDYRKLLWSDYNHVIKTITTPPEQVISDDLREYLYPVESSPELISSYLRSLFQGSVQGFMRFVAVHHVASNIWPDLQDGEKRSEERSTKLIKVLLERGRPDLIRDIVSYFQTRSGQIMLLPACFIDPPEARKDLVLRWCGDSIVSKFQEVLGSSCLPAS